MPRNMAVQSPYARIIRHEAHDNMRLCGNSNGVASHGVVYVPSRGVGAVAELAGAPTYDLETVTWSRRKSHERGRGQVRGEEGK